MVRHMVQLSGAAALSSPMPYPADFIIINADMVFGMDKA